MRREKLSDYGGFRVLFCRSAADLSVPPFGSAWYILVHRIAGERCIEIITVVSFRAFRFFGTFQRFQDRTRRTGKATLGRLVNPPLLVNPAVIPSEDASAAGPATARGSGHESERRITIDTDRELPLEAGRGGRRRSQSSTSETTWIFDRPFASGFARSQISDEGPVKRAGISSEKFLSRGN